MKIKVLLVSALLLLAGCFVIESDAFTAGGGANLPGKREKEVSRRFKNSFATEVSSYYLG